MGVTSSSDTVSTGVHFTFYTFKPNSTQQQNPKSKVNTSVTILNEYKVNFKCVYDCIA